MKFAVTSILALSAIACVPQGGVPSLTHPEDGAYVGKLDLRTNTFTPGPGWHPGDPVPDARDLPPIPPFPDKEVIVTGQVAESITDGPGNYNLVLSGDGNSFEYNYPYYRLDVSRLGSDAPEKLAKLAAIKGRNLLGATVTIEGLLSGSGKDMKLIVRKIVARHLVRGEGTPAGPDRID